MSRILIVAIAEFESAVRSKAFLIGLLALPLLMGLAFVVQSFGAQRDTSVRAFAIVDRTGVLAADVAAAARAHNAEETSASGAHTGPHFVAEIADPAGRAENDIRVELSDRVRRKELFAFVEVPAAVLEVRDEPPPLQYFSESPTYEALPDWLRGEVTRLTADHRVQRSGADPALMRKLLAPVPMDRKGLVVRTVTGGVSEAEKVDAVRTFAMPALTMFLLFGLVMTSAPQLLNSVIEEKTSRISEVLLGSVTAFQLMMGKLLGSVAITLVLALIYIGGGLLLAARADYAGIIDWSLLPWFALFLVIAVVLFGSMFIAIGAACSEVKDAQGMMTPALLLSVFPIFLWLNVVQTPDSTFSTAISMVPFATPYLMLLRIAIPPGPPMWQVVVSVIGALLTTCAMVWVAGRILRVGLLMQGKTATYREMARWVRAR